ncbi:MAG: hypothetical protein ACK4UN_15335, partial [Limisphaerales bacterium]
MTFCNTANGLFMGGIFSSVGCVERTNLAAFNLGTGEVTSWNPTANNNVLALQPHGNRMFIGGEFNTISGVTRSNLASVDINSGMLLNWVPNPNAYVTSLAAWNNRLYAGGGFTNVAGFGRTNLVEFNVDNGSVTPWDPGLNRAFVRTLAVNNNRLYAGGLITMVGTEPRGRIAAFDLTPGTPTLLPWNPSLTLSGGASIEGILPVEDRVYISGRFNGVGGQPRTNIACVTASTAALLPFASSSDQPIYAMGVISNTLVVAGDFHTLGGRSQSSIGALDATTGALSSWNPRANFFGRTVRVVNGNFIVGGAFYAPTRGVAAFPASLETPSVPNASLSRHPNGNIEMTLNGTGNSRVIVATSTNLVSWENRYSVPLTNGTAQFLDSEAPSLPMRFYQVGKP